MVDVARLIGQLKDGDDTAGAILVSVIAPRLLGYAELIAGDLSLADREEAVEHAIETAVQRIDRYDPSKGTFPGWVRGFVRHAVADWRRHHPSGAPVALDQVAEPADPNAGGTNSEEEPVNPASAALAALVLTASEADQLLLRLRFEEDLPYAQIAQQLEVSEAACRKRLERTLARLRERAADDPALSRYL